MGAALERTPGIVHSSSKIRSQKQFQPLKVLGRQDDLPSHPGEWIGCAVFSDGVVSGSSAPPLQCNTRPPNLAKALVQLLGWGALGSEFANATLGIDFIKGLANPHGEASSW